MKTTKALVTLLFLLVTQLTFAQMADGKYTFANKEMTMQISVTENGWKIASGNLINNTTKKTLTFDVGEFRRSNGLSWYEVSTSECNYSFAEPIADKLVLEQSCQGKPDTKIILQKKK